MNQKEKASRLVREFYHIDVDDITQYGMEWKMAKQCALICIDEIINTMSNELFREVKSETYIYWHKVKQEIEKL